MFRIVCDPSSGNIELYLTGIIRSGSLMFVVCLVGVWQRNFERVVCVCVRVPAVRQAEYFNIAFCEVSWAPLWHCLTNCLTNLFS